MSCGMHQEKVKQKQEKEEAEAKYKWALVDGRKEQARPSCLHVRLHCASVASPFMSCQTLPDLMPPRSLLCPVVFLAASRLHEQA